MESIATDDSIVRFFMQHVVALNVAYDPPDGRPRQRNAFTCFPFELAGDWYLVTAGHILENLYSALPKCRNVECSLFDAWQEKAHKLPVPFPLLGADHIAIDRDGLDLGLVSLPPLVRSLLQANGIRAFEEVAWRHLPTGMVHHALVGLPDQFSRQGTGPEGSVTLSVSPTLVYLRTVPPPPDMAKSFPCFYGKLAGSLRNPHSGATLEHMVGFSGSPIVGFHFSDAGQIKYFLVAVQSAWRPDLRVVVGPLISAVVALLEPKP